MASALSIGIALIFSESYRLNRILIFLNPWTDPQGRGFQIIQSLIAIGSGDVWGLGISNSKQKFFYLPMQHTDFIFPIIAEETGFVGSSILVLLYFLFCYFGIRIVTKLKNIFALFTTLGFIVLISVQAVINLMVTTGLLPTKGLGLPFVGYGGTALLCLWCMLGLITNFVRSEKT
jgi:cell division protein FtsW